MTPLPRVLSLVASFYVPPTLIDLTTPVATQLPTELIDTPLATATDLQVGLSVYGASLVVLDAGSSIEALRLRPDRLCVIAKGKVVSRQARNDARLALPGRPDSVRRRHKISDG